MNNFWEKLNKPFVTLAPMAGVTDTPFRQMCKAYGADVIYTEFASANALVYENAKTKDLISFEPKEQPVVCQIFGRDPEMFFKASKILEQMGFAGVDINFGCPAYKVVKHGGGVSLMKNLNLCREIVDATCRGTTLPVSIKMRASIKKGHGTKDKIEGEDELDDYECPVDMVTAVDLVNKVKDLPASSIMIHARSFEQPFDGEPNVNIISEIRKIWPKILIANGGIYTPEKAQEILNETGADGVGIARGSWGKPWIFKQIKDFLARGSYTNPDWLEIKKIMLEHAQLTFDLKGDYGLVELRKHLAWYVKGFSGAASLRSQLVQVKTLDDVKTILK